MAEKHTAHKANANSKTDLEQQASTFGYPLPERSPAVTDNIDEFVTGMFEQLEEDLMSDPDHSDNEVQVNTENNEST